MIKIKPIFSVPDSVLGSVLVDNIKQLVVTSCEGEAVTRACIWSLEKKSTGLVAIQNSGLGNTINPLTSFVDLYKDKLSLKILVGWRGAPTVKDELQHKKMGSITKDLLKSIGFNVEVSSNITEVKKFILNDIPIGGMSALLVPVGQLPKAKLKIQNSSDINRVCPETLMPFLVEQSKEFDVVTISTGYNSRLYYTVSGIKPTYFSGSKLRPKVIYNVGAMGFTFAMGVQYHSMGKKVLVIDGDGSALMHFGSYQKRISDIPKTIILCNGVHDSVGGFETSFDMYELFSHRKDIMLASNLNEVRIFFLNKRYKICLVQTNSLSETKLDRPI